MDRYVDIIMDLSIYGISYGFIDLRMYGFIVLWIGVFVEVCICGYMDLWIYGFMDSLVSGYMYLWIYE